MVKDVLAAFGVSTVFGSLRARKRCADRGIQGTAGAGTQTGAKAGAETGAEGLPPSSITTATHSRKEAISTPVRTGHAQLTRDRTRVGYWESLASQYAATAQSENAEVVRAGIERPRRRVERIEDCVRQRWTERVAPPPRAVGERPETGRPKIAWPMTDRPVSAR